MSKVKRAPVSQEDEPLLPAVSESTQAWVKQQRRDERREERREQGLREEAEQSEGQSESERRERRERRDRDRERRESERRESERREREIEFERAFRQPPALEKGHRKKRHHPKMFSKLGSEAIDR
ncbi:hypothetical protein HYALB_00006516 [Hymenoscyphus albidus]|uniref:Uncharacterized protein n=1 Tax=Hymenoscyphus albidus TaxID=595503 RepID=A0A9N9Q5H9_9HELO|nr:hypothetical protein HYALB_00006516 [Hymenoscyphus albidus]